MRRIHSRESFPQASGRLVIAGSVFVLGVDRTFGLRTESRQAVIRSLVTGGVLYDVAAQVCGAVTAGGAADGALEVATALNAGSAAAAIWGGLALRWIDSRTHISCKVFRRSSWRPEPTWGFRWWAIRWAGTCVTCLSDHACGRYQVGAMHRRGPWAESETSVTAARPCPATRVPARTRSCRRCALCHQAFR